MYKIKTLRHITDSTVFIILLTLTSKAIAEEFVLPLKATQLIGYYEKAKKESASVKYWRLFFEAYPDTWAEFHSFYGYDSKNKRYGYLSERVDVLYFFETAKCVPKIIFYTKLINVSVGGEWEADYTGSFQDELHKFVFKEPELTISILSKMNDEEVIEFFYFFFYSYHPPFGWIPEEIEPAAKKNGRVYKLMNTGFNKAIEMSKH